MSCQKFKFTIMIQIAQADIYLDELANYFEATELSMKQHLNSLRSYTEDNIDDYLLDQYYDEVRNYEIDFPNLLRYSIIISNISIIDFTLNKICEVLQEYFPDSTTLRDIKKRKRSSTLQCIRKFLEEQFNIKIDSDIWNYFFNLNSIRNNIAHNNGTVDRNPQKAKKLKRFIDNTDNINIDLTFSQIVVNKEFIRDMFNKSGSFFKTLNQVIKSNEISLNKIK
ncbi:hypothetical protein CHCC19466_0518 [Bacillus licheniformis]|uniref:RiboL-PSP-HEPN domain-containing protein n=1 Tax=Bacillus licheniformis TaxID=1402 RepID=A0AB37GQM5_BACLI|nr:hypothetical protein [Bacillus licheniformis]QPR74703.1 hypothetical protein I6G80_10820 [Bacillus licheniformis]TWL15060.1 hypothetical protein CHCC19466_0518 [Bacillus licheniformis]